MILQKMQAAMVEIGLRRGWDVLEKGERLYEVGGECAGMGRCREQRRRGRGVECQVERSTSVHYKRRARPATPPSLRGYMAAWSDYQLPLVLVREAATVQRAVHCEVLPTPFFEVL